MKNTVNLVTELPALSQSLEIFMAEREHSNSEWVTERSLSLGIWHESFVVFVGERFAAAAQTTLRYLSTETTAAPEEVESDYHNIIGNEERGTGMPVE